MTLTLSPPVRIAAPAPRFWPSCSAAAMIDVGRGDDSVADSACDQAPSLRRRREDGDTGVEEHSAKRAPRRSRNASTRQRRGRPAPRSTSRRSPHSRPVSRSRSLQALGRHHDRRRLALQPVLAGRRHRLRGGPRRRAARRCRVRPAQRPQPGTGRQADGAARACFPIRECSSTSGRGRLAARIGGFADKETVAQAAHNAATRTVSDAAPAATRGSSSSGTPVATAARSRSSAPSTTGTPVSSRPRSIRPAAAAPSRRRPGPVHLRRRPPGDGVHDGSGRGADGARLRRPRAVTSQRVESASTSTGSERSSTLRAERRLTGRTARQHELDVDRHSARSAAETPFRHRAQRGRTPRIHAPSGRVPTARSVPLLTSADALRSTDRGCESHASLVGRPPARSATGSAEARQGDGFGR